MLLVTVALHWRIRIKKDGKGAKKALINDQITADPVRLVGAEGEQVGIVSLSEAQAAAEAASMDLVQIAESDPAGCKLMDYGKHVFEIKKQKASHPSSLARSSSPFVRVSTPPLGAPTGEWLLLCSVVAALQRGCALESSPFARGPRPPTPLGVSLRSVNASGAPQIPSSPGSSFMEHLSFGSVFRRGR